MSGLSESLAARLTAQISRRRAMQAGAAGVAAGALARAGVAGQTPDASPAVVVPEIPAYAGEDVTLTYGFWDTAQEPAVDEQIAAFNAVYPNITIEKQIVPWADYWTQLQTAVSGGSTFDVLWLNVANFPTYAGAGALLPINQIIGGDGIDTSRMPAALVDSYSLDGVSYGLPRDFDAIAIYYNKAIFDNAGVAYPTAEWTWDDFRAAAEQLTDADAGIFGAGIQTSFQENWINFVWQNEGDLLNDDLTTVVLDEPAGDEAIQYITGFFTDGLTPSIAIQQSNAVAETLFPAGQVGFITAGSFRAGTYAETGLDLGVAPLPQGKTRAMITHGVANAIWSGTEHPGAALEFVKWLHGDEAAQILAASGSTIPSLSGTEEAWVATNPNLDLQVFVDAAQEYGISFNWPQGVGGWLDEVQAVLVDGWAGNIPAEEIAAQASAAGNAILSE